MTAAMELDQWEKEFTTDLATCMVPLDREEPADPDERGIEEVIVPLRRIYEDSGNKLSRIGKEGIKNAARIATVPIIGIADRHEKQMDKSSQKFEALQEEVANILG